MVNKQNFSEVVILGAGLTGLSLAYTLEKHNYLDYQIIEKQNEPGGLLRSFKQQGFVFDQAGHFLHSSSQEFSNFLDETLGLEKCNFIERSSFILFKDRYVPYPFQHHINYLPKEIAYECFDGFINRSVDLEPKTFLDWVQKYYGDGFAKHFFIPFNEKLLNTSLKDLSFSWTSRFVPDLTQKQIFDHLFDQEAFSKVGYNAKFIYPKQGGIFSLITAIKNKLQNPILLSAEVIFVDVVKKFVVLADGREIFFDTLVSTLPLPEFLNKTNINNSLQKDALKNLRCNSVLAINLAVDSEIQKKLHWLYLPENKYRMYRVGMWHNFSDQMAPEGKSSFYGEVSYLGKEFNKSTFDLDTIKSIQQIAEIFGFSIKDVLFHKNIFLPYGYVVYDKWRDDNLGSIHDLLSKYKIYSIGRFGEWKYSSMQEAFFDGINMANIIIPEADVFKKRLQQQI